MPQHERIQTGNDMEQSVEAVESTHCKFGGKLYVGTLLEDGDFSGRSLPYLPSQGPTTGFVHIITHKLNVTSDFMWFTGIRRPMSCTEFWHRNEHQLPWENAVLVPDKIDEKKRDAEMIRHSQLDPHQITSFTTKLEAQAMIHRLDNAANPSSLWARIQ